MQTATKEITQFESESYEEEKSPLRIVEFGKNAEDEFGPDFDPMKCSDQMKVSRFYGQSTII